MIDDPSNYEASIILTYQQMWEISKAISARMADWIAEDVVLEKKEQMEWLIQVQQILELHINRAVDEWENGRTDHLTDAGTHDLDEAIEKMLDEDDEAMRKILETEEDDYE